MSHARILRHPLLWALRRQGGQRHGDKLQRHAEKLQYSGDGEHTHSRIDRTIQLCCLHEAKTENSEIEMGAQFASKRARFNSKRKFLGCQEIRIKKPRTKTIQKRKTWRHLSRGTALPARLDNAPRQNRAFGKAPLAGPRVVSERLSRGKGYFRGKPKIASMRNGRDCDLQSRPLRFEASIFGLPLKEGQLKATSSVIIMMKPAITPHVPRCG